MPFVFTREHWAHIAKHRQQDHAVLLRPSESVAVGTVRRAWREHAKHDEHGVEVGTVRTELDDVVTVQLVYRVDWYEGTGLGVDLARACGFRAVSDLRAAWRRRHPRTPLATAAWFRVGDLRDRDIYLTSVRSMRYGPARSTWRTRPAKPTKKRMDLSRAGVGDYTRNPRVACDDVPALTPEQTAALAAFNHQWHVRRSADTQAAYAAESHVERLQRIEAGGTVAVAIVRHELRGLQRYIERESRRLARAA